MPATPYTQIADLIAAKLATVANVGQVHNFQRNFTDSNQFLAECVDTVNQRVAFWTISRETFTDTQSSNYENTYVATWILRGHMAVKDSNETELIFQQVIDDVREEFRPQSTLSDSVELTRPIQGRIIGYQSVHEAFCHVCELTFETQEFYNA